MRRNVLALILGAAFVAACSSSGGGTVVTVLGYTVTIKTAPPTTAQVGTSIPVAFTVTENESDGSAKPASGKSFTVTVTAGGGAINGAASATLTTGADGSVSLTWTLGPTVGTQTVRGAAASDKYLDVTVTATAPPVSTVTVTLAASSITLGTTGDQATAVTKDASGNVLLGRTVTWQSSDMTVATVSGTGVVTTVGVGTSTITATSEGRSGSAPLTVVTPPAPWIVVLHDLGPRHSKASVLGVNSFVKLTVFCDATTPTLYWGLVVENLGTVPFADGVLMTFSPSSPGDPRPTWNVGSGTLSLDILNGDAAAMEAIIPTRTSALFVYPSGSGPIVSESVTFDLRVAATALSQIEASCRTS